jgi:chromosome segregation ATPase
VAIGLTYSLFSLDILSTQIRTHERTIKELIKEQEETNNLKEQFERERNKAIEDKEELFQERDYVLIKLEEKDELIQEKDEIIEEQEKTIEELSKLERKNERLEEEIKRLDRSNRKTNGK